MKHISIIGSTGSIGEQALDIIDKNRDLFVVDALVANKNINLLRQQISKYSPKLVGVVDDEAYKLLKKENLNVELIGGEEALMAAAAYPTTDILLTAVVGAVGIKPTIEAIKHHKTIALANKETLVAAGEIITELAAKHQIQILPVDSEHSAIFQCLEGQTRDNVDKLILTASGGPLRTWSSDSIKNATVKECLNHPNWSMGSKITIDSSTLFNKGLEVIEAHWLFNFDYNDIEVVVHPESIIHSMIRLKDGAILSQMGSPNMREPIQYAFTYPQRLPLAIQHLDFNKTLNLTFEPPRYADFPALKLAYEVGRAGGLKPTIFNAANEVAVYAFLDNKIKFTDIYEIVYKVLAQEAPLKKVTLENILNIDIWARNKALEFIH